MVTKFNINEDNKDVEKHIDYLNNLVIKLRESGKGKRYLKSIEKFYKNFVEPWSKEYYLNQSEISEDEENEMINEILELIKQINIILKK